MLFKYLKEGDYDKAVKEINHNENEKGMGGQKKRRAFERRVFSTPTYQPWTVDDDSNYVLIEDKPVENESIEKILMIQSMKTLAMWKLNMVIQVI